MKIFRDLASLRSWRRGLPASQSVGVVPTMGGLHAGHDSLVLQANSQCDYALVTLFVNPLQFNESRDFDHYPRPEEEDCRRLEALNTHAVYLPDPDAMYPQGFDTHVIPGAGGRLFEGEFRPGHFQGVLTVVLKLLIQTQPHKAFFGQKDAQQLFLVRRMVDDFNLETEIVACETVREKDGLALSSRNVHLSQKGRDRALVLYRALQAAQQTFAAGTRNWLEIEAHMHQVYQSEGIRPEYAKVVDEATFQAPAKPGTGSWRAVTAAQIGTTRLIDNLFLGTC